MSPKVAAGSIERGERGVYAIEKVQGALAYVPLDCCITAEEGQPLHPLVLEALGGSADRVALSLQLAVQLLLHASAKPSSPLAPYIASLPPPVSASPPPTLALRASYVPQGCFLKNAMC